MEKILNQDEIDALFHHAAQERVSQPEPPGGEKRHITPCNFHRAGMIAREDLRAVNLLHETFARNLSRSLGAYLRVAFEVNLVSTEQIMYGEFLQHVPEVNYVVSLNLCPFDATVVAEMDLQLAFPLIDLLLGGPGQPFEQVRDVTEIEEEILKGVVQLICGELRMTWQSVMDTEFQFDERQRRAQILRLMPPNEKILSLSYEIRMTGVSGMLVTAFPAVAANALVRKLAQQGSYRRRRASSDGISAMRGKLEKCSFPVELILPAGAAGSRELLGLKTGSILVLRSKVHDPAVLRVQKQELFTAQPVRSGNYRAARIVQSIPASDPLRSKKNDQ
jgi:flagellar motor switch protein FliM